MKRFQVLDRNTKIFGRYFLEASAGTGKTFAIEHIATRAILDMDNPISIDKILIVTFTRAATRELKLRIRSNLGKTLLYLQRGIAGPDYLKPIFDKGGSALFSAERRIEEALCHFDKASIYTLHGFCHKMLSEYAFEAGTFFEIPSPDKPLHSQRIFQVVEDFFRAGIDPSNYSPSQVAKALKISSRGIEGLFAKIVSWIERAPSIEPSLSFSSLLEQFNKTLMAIRDEISFTMNSFEDDLRKVLPLYKRVQAKHYDQALKIASCIQEGRIRYEDLDAILNEKDFFLSLLKEENIKKGKDPSKVLLSHPRLFSMMRKSLYPLIEKGSDPYEIFLRLTHDCMNRWQASKYFEESFSPDDLLKKMLLSLEAPELKEKISEKFSMAIIDEFQDTDPMQWKIFHKLFVAVEGKALYLVGDPKQSIYAFRSADVYTYLEAMKALGEENRLFLDTNYRSEPELVTALNTLFNHNLSKNWMQLPSLGLSLDVRAVLSRENSSNHIEDEPRVHFFVAEGHMGRSRRWPSEDVESDQLFPFIQEQIKTSGYNLSQFAILVRDRFQAARLESYLKKNAIACSVKKPFRLCESPCFLFCCDVIEAVLSPDDRSVIKRALGSPFIGMDSRNLSGGRELGAMQKARLFFQKARGLVQKKGWGAFFNCLLESTWGEKTVLESLLGREDLSFYFELRQLMQIFLQAPQEILFSLEPFFSYFKALAMLDEEDELLKVAAETEEDQVTIMTIHASKGLEFDVVFALGLVSRSGSVDDVVKVRSQEKEMLQKWDENDPNCINSILELDAEKMRHLYVALTRAKKRVYIPYAFDKDRVSLSPSEASSIELLVQSFGRVDFDLKGAYDHIASYTWGDLKKHLDELKTVASVGYSYLPEMSSQKNSSHRQQRDNIIKEKEALELSFPVTKTLSFSSLDLAEHSTQEIDAVDDTEIPLGADTGVVIHSIFEEVIKRGLYSPYCYETILSLIEEKTRLLRLFSYKEKIASIISEVFHLKLVSPNASFCLTEIDPANFYLEMDFSFEFHGNLMKGVIDALFIYRGKYYIIDWKSNYLAKDKEGYTSDAMQQAMDSHRYDLQGAIYTEALKRYLALLGKKDFDAVFGGAFYLFVRGGSFYHFFPNISSLDQIMINSDAQGESNA